MHTVLKCFHWPSRPPSSTSKYSWTRMPASDMSATWAVSSRSSMGAGVEARAVGCISGPACDAGAKLGQGEPIGNQGAKQVLEIAITSNRRCFRYRRRGSAAGTIEKLNTSPTFQNWRLHQKCI